MFVIIYKGTMDRERPSRQQLNDQAAMQWRSIFGLSVCRRLLTVTSLLDKCSLIVGLQKGSGKMRKNLNQTKLQQYQLAADRFAIVCRIEICHCSTETLYKLCGSSPYCQQVTN
ncbi:Guanine nucleotide exchange factor [Trichinella pseudospiralis]